MTNTVCVYPIRAFLDVSTGHLKFSTREWLTEQHKLPESSSNAFSGSATLYGWFINCSHDSLEEGADQAITLKDIPEDLVTCLKYGRAQGCDYVLFDRDAPALFKNEKFALPYYEDADTAILEKDAASF